MSAPRNAVTALLLAAGALAAAPAGTVVGGPFEEALYSIVENSDGTLAAAGFATRHPPSRAIDATFDDPFEYLEALHRQNGEQARLICLSQGGRIIRERPLVLGVFSRAVALLTNPAGGYIAGGYDGDGQLAVNALGGEGKHYLTRFGTSGYDRMVRLVMLRDGGVLAVGSSATTRDANDPLFLQGLGRGDLFLTRLSRTGEILWSRKYGSSGDEEGVDAAEAGDGTLLVVANRDGETGPSVVLMRLSETGDPLWHRSYTGADRAHAIVARGDGSFTVSLSRHEKERETIRLLTFDLQQRILSERDLPAKADRVLYDLALRESGIVGAGYIRENGKSGKDALLMALDNDGTVLWEKRFGEGGRDLFRSVVVLRDGSVAAAGETTAPGREERDMWIVRVDGSGNVPAASAH